MADPNTNDFLGAKPVSPWRRWLKWGAIVLGLVALAWTENGFRQMTNNKRDIVKPADAAGLYRKSALASSFVAVLELARQGKVELRQKSPFAPLYVRSLR